MLNEFQTKAHAKWILAGEHAVLRGHPALVFPIPSKFIELSYADGAEPLEVDFHTPHGETFLILFWGVFEEALKLLEKKHHDLSGKLFFRNNIPMGAGMGFSAAFCVSLAKFFQWKGWVSESGMFEFARLLENHFHGKSSGVDIAGSLYDAGVCYQIDKPIKTLEINWRPHLYLSHSGHVSVTSKCINLVKELWADNKTKAEQIDQEMENSVLLGQEALLSTEENGLAKLKQAIEKANQCFSEWGLLNPDLKAHMAELKTHGAIASKPTGAGDGGYVLSLWDNKIPDLSIEMIAVF